MKIYVSKNKQLYSVYRIVRSKTGQLISGSFAPFGNLLEPAFPGLSDVHFSYPADGNVHYTFKMTNDQSIRGYWDRIVFRPSGSEIPRDSNFPLFNLLPDRQLASLTDYRVSPHFYQIASSTFNLGDAPYYVSTNASRNRPTGKDIVVDANEYAWINMLGFLVGYDSDFKFQTLNEQSILEYRIDDTAYPHIHTVITGTKYEEVTTLS